MRVDLGIAAIAVLAVGMGAHAEPVNAQSATPAERQWAIDFNDDYELWVGTGRDGPAVVVCVDSNAGPGGGDFDDAVGVEFKPAGGAIEKNTIDAGNCRIYQGMELITLTGADDFPTDPVRGTWSLQTQRKWQLGERGSYELWIGRGRNGPSATICVDTEDPQKGFREFAAIVEVEYTPVGGVPKKGIVDAGKCQAYQGMESIRLNSARQGVPTRGTWSVP